MHHPYAFGLSSAPRICTMLLSVLQSELHHCGVPRLVRYLDDFLPIDTSMHLRPEHRATRVHAAAVGHSVRPRRAGHTRHPLPRRLLSHRPVRERHDPRPALRTVGHSSVRPGREAGQDGGAGPAPVLPWRPVGLGRTDRVLHSRARGGADHRAPLPPPPASHHATAHTQPP